MKQLTEACSNMGGGGRAPGSTGNRAEAGVDLRMSAGTRTKVLVL